MAYNKSLMPRYFAPKGTHDILPSGSSRTDWADDIAKWHFLENAFRELCHLYGYEEIRTPAFEQTDLFKRAVGEGTDIVGKEMYEFTTKGGDEVTLRPEGTAPALRAYIERRVYIERPVAKLFYFASIFRYERPQKGRYRQHHQVGVEVLGARGPDIDAEVIALALAFFTRLGVPNLTLKLNSVGTKESREKFVDALRQFAAPHLSEMSEDNQRRYEQNALRMLDSKNERDQEILRDAPYLSDYLDEESRTHFEQLKELLTLLGIGYEMDGRLVRGFDYYSRTAFEVVSPDVGSQSALAGGGRYDALMSELGGPATPGIGFGLGIERTLIALQTAQVPVPDAPGLDAYLYPLGEASRRACVVLMAQLRASRLACDMDYKGRKIGAAIEAADFACARYLLTVGEDEIRAGTVSVRDMASKEKAAVPLAEIAAFLHGNPPVLTQAM